MKVHKALACFNLGGSCCVLEIEMRFSLKNAAIGMAPAFARLHKPDGSACQLQEFAASGFTVGLHQCGWNSGSFIWRGFQTCGWTVKKFWWKIGPFWCLKALNDATTEVDWKGSTVYWSKDFQTFHVFIFFAYILYLFWHTDKFFNFFFGSLYTFFQIRSYRASAWHRLPHSQSKAGDGKLTI